MNRFILILYRFYAKYTFKIPYNYCKVNYFFILYSLNIKFKFLTLSLQIDILYISRNRRYHSPGFTNNNNPHYICNSITQYLIIYFLFIILFYDDRIIEWYLVINGYRTRRSAISTQCTYTITTYLLKPINYSTLHMSMRVHSIM